MKHVGGLVLEDEREMSLLEDGNLSLSEDTEKIVNSTVTKISQVLICEEYVDIFILQVLNFLDIKNVKYLDELAGVLRKCFNEETTFNYNEDTEEILSINLSEMKVHEFYKEIASFIAKIENEGEIEEIKSERAELIEEYKEQINQLQKATHDLESFCVLQERETGESSTADTSYKNKQRQDITDLIAHHKAKALDTKGLLRSSELFLKTLQRKKNDSRYELSFTEIQSKFVGLFPLKLPKEESMILEEHSKGKNKESINEGKYSHAFKNLAFATIAIATISTFVNETLIKETTGKEISPISNKMDSTTINIPQEYIKEKEKGINIPINLTETQLTSSTIEVSFPQKVMINESLEKLQVVEIGLHPEQDILLGVIHIESLDLKDKSLGLSGDIHNNQQMKFYIYRGSLEKKGLKVTFKSPFGNQELLLNIEK